MTHGQFSALIMMAGLNLIVLIIIATILVVVADRYFHR